MKTSSPSSFKMIMLPENLHEKSATIIIFNCGALLVKVEYFAGQTFSSLHLSLKISLSKILYICMTPQTGLS